MTEFNSRQLRSAFGAYLTGVTIVTAKAADGALVGFTANSFTTVSLEPPLLLVCPSKNLSSYPVFSDTKHFAVSVLAEGQEAISNIFASSKEDRFAQSIWHTDDNGSPLITHAAAHFSCTLHNRIDAGDHDILIGRVTNFEVSGKPGLGFCNRGYFSLGLERRADGQPHSAGKTIAGALVVHDGHLLLEETANGVRLPEVVLDQRYRARAALSDHFTKIGMAVDLEEVYSIFDDRQTGNSYTYFRATAKNPVTPPHLHFVKMDQIKIEKFASSSCRTMVTRYMLESRNQLFSIYFGDEDRGDIHMIGRTQK